MRKVSATIIAILIGAGLTTLGAPAFGASSDESGFFSRTNHERSVRGIKTVLLDAHLSDVARRHSQEMASRNDLYHNDNLGNEVDGWEELDENVGEGRTIDDIHNAFMDSPVHRSGILGNYEKVGIGTAWRNGTLWVTEVFFRAQKKQSTTVRRTTTTVRRHASPTVTPPRRAPAPRAAAAPKAPPVAPVAPPIAAVIPAYSSGKIQKLLGDLEFAGSAREEQDEVAAPGTETKLASVLWEFVESKAA